jgi:hypothetical protein
MKAPCVSFEHLLRLTDDIGLFEHADHSTPRRHHGYCLDDVGRALVVVVREPQQTAALTELTGRYLDFVASAQAEDGRFHNRLGLDRRWKDVPSVEDCWGRALWALGTTAARADTSSLRSFASDRFARSARWRCGHRRSMAFAALGATEVLSVTPDDSAARTLLRSAVAVIGRPTPAPTWPWPEARLTYANAVLPEVLIAAGQYLDDGRALDDGLRMLDWLLDIETSGTHLSVVPVGGWGRGEARPGFDQQPIEVAALTDACARALQITGEARWARAVELGVNWFLGDNDAGIPLYDPLTGGGYDGLHVNGRNANQGAESTLAMISTLQHARRLVPS